MAHDIFKRKQNVTVSLSRKAKYSPPQRSTSVSELLAEQMQSLVGTHEAYERCERAALAILDNFRLRSVISAANNCISGKAFFDTSVLICPRFGVLKRQHWNFSSILN